MTALRFICCTAAFILAFLSGGLALQGYPIHSFALAALSIFAMWSLIPEEKKEVVELDSGLLELYAFTEEAVTAAAAHEFKNAAVNWGDIRCSEAFIKTSYESGIDKVYCVVLSEASPDNYEFCEFISQYLATRGFINVEVTTEW